MVVILIWTKLSYATESDNVYTAVCLHCKEHLHKLARLHYGEKPQDGELFVKKVMDCFFESRVGNGIQEVEKLETKKQKAKEKKELLLNYLKSNKKRIDYGKFRKQGYLIGSGAIEAAHRNVIQKRLKLSGQRWTMKGAQQVANIRVEEKSGRWGNVLDLIVNQKPAA